jgi:hypothetical protein
VCCVRRFPNSADIFLFQSFIHWKHVLTLSRIVIMVTLTFFSVSFNSRFLVYGVCTSKVYPVGNLGFWESFLALVNLTASPCSYPCPPPV